MSEVLISKLSLNLYQKLKKRTTHKMTSVRYTDGSSAPIVQETIVCAGYRHRQTPTLRDINLERRLTVPSQRDTTESYAPIFRKRRVIKPTTTHTTRQIRQDQNDLSTEKQKLRVEFGRAFADGDLIQMVMLSRELKLTPSVPSSSPRVFLNFDKMLTTECPVTVEELQRFHDLFAIIE